MQHISMKAFLGRLVKPSWVSPGVPVCFGKRKKVKTRLCAGVVMWTWFSSCGKLQALEIPSQHLWLHGPRHPLTVSLQWEGRGQSNNKDLSSLCYRREIEQPLPRSLRLPLQSIEPAGHISCNSRQHLLSKKGIQAPCQHLAPCYLLQGLQSLGLPSSSPPLTAGRPQPGMAAAAACYPACIRAWRK